MEAMMPAQSYTAFIESKSQLANQNGFEPIWMPGFLFDFQQYLVDWALRVGRSAVLADCGMGKALANDTPVATPDGFVPIADLSVGDYVIGSNGQPTEVLGVFPQGERDGFMVTFSDDSSLVCDEEHLWTARTMNGRRGIGIELKPSYYRQAMRNIESVLANGWGEADLNAKLDFGEPDSELVEESV